MTRLRLLWAEKFKGLLDDYSKTDTSAGNLKIRKLPLFKPCLILTASIPRRSRPGIWGSVEMDLLLPQLIR